jgi:hypothetical protein
LVDQGLGLLEVAEHAMTQHSAELPAIHRLVGLLAIALEQRHPLPGLGRQPLESRPSFVEHRR